jgi:Mlc titration factor MtfA (ptsG expression regulator)
MKKAVGLDTIKEKYMSKKFTDKELVVLSTIIVSVESSDGLLALGDIFSDVDQNTLNVIIHELGEVREMKDYDHFKRILKQIVNEIVNKEM